MIISFIITNISFKKIIFLYCFITLLFIPFGSSLASISNTKNEDTIDYLERLSDGQTLLLRPRSEKIVYDDDLYAIKINNEIYYSIADFIDILDLAISYQFDDKKGTGWFLREDWRISLDFNNNIVTARGREYSVSAEDVIHQDNTTFVRESAIEDWFGFTIEPDIPQQYVNIITPYPLPIVAQHNRKQALGRKMNAANDPIFPRKDITYDWLDINTADVRLGVQAQNLNDSEQRNIKQSAVIAAQGQALKHNAYLSASYDNNNALSSVVSTLSKRNENPTLLGPLKARSYSVGDTNSVQVPLMGNNTQNLGLRVSNSPLINNQFQTATINGNAIIGWDVELYRNNILIDRQVISTSSQYQFDDVELFAGENKFQVFFYGPQGEVRVEEINLPVNAALLDTQDNIYDASISFNDTQTYRKNKINTKDRNTLNFSGIYKKKVGKSLAYLGLQSRQIDEIQKNIMGLGATSLFKETLIDTNIAADLSGEASAQLAARKNLGGWDMSANALTQTSGYSPNNETFPKNLEFGVSGRRNFDFEDQSKLNIVTSHNYIKNSNGASQFSSELGTSYFKNGLNLSNNLNYSTTGFDSDRNDTVENIVSVRGNYKDLFFRGGTSYNIIPNAEITDYLAQINYQPHSRFSTDLTYRYRPFDEYSNWRLNLNNTNKYFRISPFVEYDSNNDLYAGLNMNFSVIDTPNATIPSISSNRLVGKGLVSSKVYYDKNGNMVFDENDEVLPDVVVKSINVKRRDTTDQNGYSLIDNLPVNRATDITVDDATLPDSFMITANDGISVLPEPGEIIEVEFPIHLSGEIDGTVSLIDENENLSTVRRAKVDLYSLDKKDDVIQTRAAMDGFFVVSQIPPGRYLMAVNKDTINQYDAGTDKPKIIDIGYDGDVYYDKNITLDKNKPYVPIKVSYSDKDNNELQKLKHHEDQINQQNEQYKISTQSQGISKLSMLLGNFAQKNVDHSIYTDMQSVTVDNPQSYIYTAHQDTIDDAYEKCQKLSAKAIPCSMEVIVPVQ